MSTVGSRLNTASPYLFVLVGLVVLYFIIGLEQTIWVAVPLILAIGINRSSEALTARERPKFLAALNEDKAYIGLGRPLGILMFVVWLAAPVVLFIRYGWKAPLAFIILSFVYGIVFAIRGELFGTWDTIRRDLIALARESKKQLPNNVEVFLTSIMRVSPAFKRRYEPYLKYISDNSLWVTEWERYPEDVIDAVALHLLCAVVDHGDAWGWSVSTISSYGADVLVNKSLLMLDRVLTLLVQKERWNDIYTFNVAGLLVPVTGNTSRRDNIPVPGGLKNAHVRSLYAAGAAAFYRGDLETALKIWVRCDVEGQGSTDPAYKQCKESLAKFFPGKR